MSDAEILVFRAWPHAGYDLRGLPPDGRYSRLAWLPTVGPTSWLLWGSIAAELGSVAEYTVDDRVLARSLGLSPGGHRGRVMPRVLRRLCMFRLLTDTTEGYYQVRLTAPPVSRNALGRLPVEVQRFHAELFGDPQPPPAQ